MDYLDKFQLSALTHVSVATIWRLKLAGKIPFFQPGGKGTLVKFPADALERGTASSTLEEKSEAEDRLPGRKPAWQQKNNH